MAATDGAILVADNLEPVVYNILILANEFTNYRYRVRDCIGFQTRVIAGITISIT